MMMMITKKHLSRRTVLRGLGATIALPLLDGMVPAMAAIRNTAAAPVRRFGAVYAPMGMNMEKWWPASEGGLELSPILQPLAPFKNRTLVVSGLDNKEADARDGGPHPRVQTAWLTGAQANRSEGADVRAGISMDQVIAKEYATETQLASLELALEGVDLLGACTLGYSCAYTSTISWRGATLPLPMENNPRAVFERLFGGSDSTDKQARLVQIQKQASILDSVTDKIAHLETGIGPSDHVKLSEYLDAVRDVERRIQKAEEQIDQDLPVVEQPVGIPSSFEAHARLMYDLLLLAFQVDLTRVATFLLGREQSSRSWPEIGVPDPWHGMSHHQDNPEQLEKQAKVNTFHLQQFAYFLEKLQSTPAGDGSLLDQTMLLYGSGMSNSNTHYMYNLPTVLVAGKSLNIKGGRHVRYPRGTPLMNLHLTLLDKMGVPVERLGDSTGELHLLSV